MNYIKNGVVIILYEDMKGLIKMKNFNFEKLPTKRIVFVLLIIAYISFTAYSMLENKETPPDFIDIVKLVVTFYFGVTVGEKNKKSEKQTKEELEKEII